MSEDMQRKSYEEYVNDRRKLAGLQAPAMRVTIGSDRDVEFQKEATLTYTLNMVGHLLERIEVLEKRLAEKETAADDGDDIPMGGGIESPFDPNDRPWEG
ncbi:hypothetical protein [Microbacterium testaceum]|uniref:hypothetical protein n=1 Tax=Microbacterium testaceum TaxID=2033 RepID=UPI002434C444|nr:hypothetical protein [Microbacterium testaceum]